MNRAALFDERYFQPPSFVSNPAPEPEGGQRHVVRGSLWFVASVATGAALSFLYWVLAARLTYDSEVFGQASSLWAQVQLVNYLTGMGLPIAMARYGSARPRTVHVLFVWALVYTTATSAVGTAIFGLVAPRLIGADFLQPLWRWGTLTGLVLFFLLITGMSFALLVEVRLVTLRQWSWVFGRVMAMSLIRLPFLLLPLFNRSPIGLLLLIAGTPALSGFLGAWGIRSVTPLRDRGPLLPLPLEAGPAFRFASVNYLGMLAAQAPQFGLPVVVTGFVSAEEFGAFYVAWQITVMVFLVPHTIGQIVLTEGSRSSDAVNHQARLGLKLSMGLMAVATVGALIASRLGLVTAVFPDSYHQTGGLLPLLVSAGIPWAVTCVCLAKARVEGDHVRTVVITVGFAFLTLLPAVAMTARSGVGGAAAAWFIGNVLAAGLAVGATMALTDRVRGDLVPSERHAGVR